MNRLRDLERYIEPYIIERIIEIIKKVKMKKEQIADPDQASFIKTVKILIEKALNYQQIDQNWEVKYLSVFHLKSSLITKSYQYQICLTDELFYLDQKQIVADWIPEVIYDQLAEEQKLLVKYLMKKFVRLQEYEVTYLMQKLVEEYKKVIEVYLANIVSYMTASETYQSLQKKNPFLFLYGDYLGEIKMIASDRGGSLDE